MVTNSLVTVLVNSCDKYEEAWLPFLSLFKKYWPTCNFSMAINTESKDFSMDGMEIQMLHSCNTSWGGRLYEALQKIKTPYVIVLLEDFFFQKPVLEDKINACINALERNPSIAVFYFSHITGYKGSDDDYEGFMRMNASPDYSRYYLNCQAAIWRRDSLMKAVEKCDSPWNLEEMRYEQIPAELRHMHFYCSTTTWYDKFRDGDIFSYLLVRETGYGIYQSKWLWNNKKLFQKEGIPCKCETLPTLTKWSFMKQKYSNLLREKIYGKATNKK